MERPSNFRFGCAAFLFAAAAFSLVPAAIETMRGAAMISPPAAREARGGELLTTGQRAAPGDAIRRADTSVELSDELVRLLVGSGAAALGLVILVLAIRDRRKWRRQQRGED